MKYRHDLTPEIRAQITAERRAGHTLKSLSERYNIVPSTVFHIANCPDAKPPAPKTKATAKAPPQKWVKDVTYSAETKRRWAQLREEGWGLTRISNEGWPDTDGITRKPCKETIRRAILDGTADPCDIYEWMGWTRETA